MSETERTGIGDERPEERTMNDQPGLSGGEYPGAEEQLDAMSESPAPSGQATTFGDALGDYGPAGTMGTIDEGNALSDYDPTGTIGTIDEGDASPE